MGVPPPLQVWRGEGKVKGRVPDLAAGRRGLVSRREAQWAWPSSPHDLHFAQKKARQRGGDVLEVDLRLGLVQEWGVEDSRPE